MKIYANSNRTANLDRFIGKDLWIGVQIYYSEPTWLSWYKIIEKKEINGKLYYIYHILFDDDYLRMKRGNWSRERRLELLNDTNYPCCSPADDDSLLLMVENSDEYLTTNELFMLDEE